MAAGSGSRADRAKARPPRSAFRSPELHLRFASAHITDGDAKNGLPKRNRVTLSERTGHDLAHQLGRLRPQLLGPRTAARMHNPEASVNHDAPPIEEVGDLIHLERDPLVVFESSAFVSFRGAAVQPASF